MDLAFDHKRRKEDIDVSMTDEQFTELLMAMKPPPIVSNSPNYYSIILTVILSSGIAIFGYLMLGDKNDGIANAVTNNDVKHMNSRLDVIETKLDTAIVKNFTRREAGTMIEAATGAIIAEQRLIKEEYEKLYNIMGEILIGANKG